MKTCSFRGHEHKKVKYYCFDQTCQLERLHCSQCYYERMHQHNNENNLHIFDNSRFSEKVVNLIEMLMEQVKCERKNHQKRVFDLELILQEIKKQLSNIKTALKDIIKQLENDPDILQLEMYLLQVQSKQFHQMEDDLVNELANIQSYQMDKSAYYELKRQSDSLIEQVIRLKQLSEQFLHQDQQQLLKQIQNMEYKLTKLEESDRNLHAATISSDLRYIVSGGSAELLKIWSYQNHILIRQERLDNWIFICKFTDDNSFLYVGTGGGLLYQFDAEKYFEQTLKLQIHKDSIYNIYCISNYEILTSSLDLTIIKTYVSANHKINRIYAHNDRIDGLDYNKFRDLIVSCSTDRSIKLWNCSTGQLVIQKQNAHNNSKIYQVLFINDQLISLDNNKQVHIWKINLDQREIRIMSTIMEQNYIFNISLVLDQQFITLICDQSIKIYSITGQLVKQILHNVKEFCIKILYIRYESSYLVKFDGFDHYSRKKPIKDMSGYYVILYLFNSKIIIKYVIIRIRYQKLNYFSINLKLLNSKYFRFPKNFKLLLVNINNCQYILFKIIVLKLISQIFLINMYYNKNQQKTIKQIVQELMFEELLLKDGFNMPVRNSSRLIINNHKNYYKKYLQHSTIEQKQLNFSGASIQPKDETPILNIQKKITNLVIPSQRYEPRISRQHAVSTHVTAQKGFPSLQKKNSGIICYQTIKASVSKII
ncbi:WD repeat-containing protein 6 [Paramecium bursaria]